MRRIPVEEAAKHFAIIGATGTGKSTLIRLFVQSIAPRFLSTSPTPEQLVIFDFKGDAVPMLARLGLRPDDPNVWLLNPYDARSAVWDLGHATQEPVMVDALAHQLIPEEPNCTAPYFPNAARELVRAVVLAMNTIVGADWSLRDLIWTLLNANYIKAVAARDPEAEATADPFLNDTLHLPAILTTVASRFGRYRQVAALWHSNRTKRRFSVVEFLKRPGVMVLGNDPVLRKSLWPINAVLLQALTNEILRRPDQRQPRTWFVLDEFPAMERVDCIHEMVNLGRSKGVSVLLGLQSLPGLMNIYEEKGANDILGQCTCKTFLRVGDPITADWMSRFFGSVRRVERTISESLGPGGWSRSTQSSLVDRPMFLPSFFLNLPLTGPGKILASVSDVPCFGQTVINRCPLDRLLACLLPVDSQEDVPGVVPRTNLAEQRLAPWTDEEKRRFLGPDWDGGGSSSPRPGPTKPDNPGNLPRRHELTY